MATDERRLGEFLQCRHGRLVKNCPECRCRRCKIDPLPPDAADWEEPVCQACWEEIMVRHPAEA